jgi:hypothetical protein
MLADELEDFLEELDTFDLVLTDPVDESVPDILMLN